MKLIIGKDYSYWSKSIYEDKPSKKFCRLVSVSKAGTEARVFRYDLDVHSIQTVEVKRLKPAFKDEEISQQMRLL